MATKNINQSNIMKINTIATKLVNKKRSILATIVIFGELISIQLILPYLIGQNCSLQSTRHQIMKSHYFYENITFTSQNTGKANDLY